MATPAHRHRGFSMIDLMVGLLIALLVGLAVYSTTITLGAQRRTMISGNDAMSNGVASLAAIQRDIKAAGHGIWLNNQPLCLAINIYYNGSVRADGAAVVPVLITPGANNQSSDAITVMGGASALSSVAMLVSATMPLATSPITVPVARGIAANDLLLVGTQGSAAPCTLMQATALDTATGWTDSITHASATWNPANPNVFTTAPAYPAGSMLVNTGSTLSGNIPFNWLTYSVANGNLQVANAITGTTEVVADNVVMMRAYYGTTNGATSQIEQWVPATDSWAAPLDASHIAAIRAVRLAVIARAAHPEKPSVVGGACDTTTTAPAAWTGGPTIDLSGDANWRCYRYRTMTLVVPLTNILFGAT